MAVPSEPSRVTRSRTRAAPGRVVRIDLGDGRVAYGRVLAGGTAVECYDRADRADPPRAEIDLPALTETPVAFTVGVMRHAFSRTSPWELLDVVTLTEREQNAVHRYAKQDAITKRLSVYWEEPATGRYGEEPATPDDVAGLEVAAVWDPGHVEDRLRDHFDGRPNTWAESIRPKPADPPTNPPPP